ncbi:MAG TPA: glycosyltransferase, partial [bacterium]
VVSGHNEAHELPGLLERLNRQSYPKNRTEILLVDDRSTDSTYRIMQRFAGTKPGRSVLKILKTPPGISPKKHALATALAVARGKICITTDADARPHTDWIVSVVRTYTHSTAAVIGYAPYRTDYPFHTVFHRVLALEYFSLAAVSLASSIVGRPLTCNGANFSYRKHIFESIGGFGESIRLLSGDDDLLLHRIQAKAPGRIRYAIDPEAAVFNAPPHTFSQWLQQRIRFASKHLFYPPGVRTFLIAIYAFYFIFFALCILSFFSMSCALLLVLAIAVKSACEICFLLKAKRILEKRNLLRYYPLAFFPHVLYVVFIPLLSRFIRPKWGPNKAV